MAFGRFFRRQRRDEELQQEIDSYLAEETDENLARGMPFEEARRQALLKFGSRRRVSEDLWQQNTLTTFDNIWRDVRYAWRILARSPGFAATAVLTMALGIGATTLVFSVVYGAVLNPYPYRDAKHIVQMGFMGKQGIRGFMAVNADDFETVRHASTVEDAMLADFGDPITTAGGYPEDIEIARMSGNAFEFLGVAPLLGRTLTVDDREQAVAVLSYEFCRGHFACDPAVLGKKLDLDNRQFLIVGVMPQRFGWERAAAFVPLVPGTDPDQGYPLYVRARPGVDATALSAEMLSLVKHFVFANEGVTLPPDTTLKPIRLGERSGGHLERRIGLLFVAVCMLMLIACVNVSILMLGRASARQHEFEVRHALGASRSRIVRQVLTEALLVAAAGGALGIAFTYAGLGALRTPLLRSVLPSETDLSVNGWVLLFSTATSIVCGIFFGLSPSLQVSRRLDAARLNVRFKSGSRRQRRTHGALVGSQIGLTLVLLVVAGGAVQSFVGLYRMNLGYDPHQVLTFRLPIPDGQYQGWSERVRYQMLLRERLQRIPGVKEASVDEAMPTGGGFQMEYGAPGEQYGEDMDIKMPRADMEFVGDHFLSSLRIPVMKGRSFTGDELQRGEPVVLANQTFARRLFGGGNPLGHTLVIPPLNAGYPAVQRPPNPQRGARIVGVTGDVRAAWQTSAPARETLYLPESLFAVNSSLRVHLRTVGDRMSVLETARRTVMQVNPSQPISQPRTLDDILSEDLRSRDRWLATLLGIFSISALVLAGIGLYSVATFAVAQRTKEFGVRVALGAQRAEILRLALLSESKVVLFGLAAGAGASFFVQKTIGTLMTVPPKTGWLIVPACVLMVCVGVVASLLPARRAARANPVSALRSD